MKAVGITGYKNSGKTTLLINLAKELSKRRIQISSVKHVSCKLDLPGTDTTLHRQHAYQAAAVSDDESAIFFRESLSLEDMLSYMKSDFVLIEGFKSKKTFPKIVCLKPNEDPHDLLDGLEICIIGSSINSVDDIKVPVLDKEKDIVMIADIAEEKAFKLPDLNCGACGFDTCYELAKQIVSGNRTIQNCKSLYSDIQIKVKGQVIPVNPFVSKLFRNTIKGMLSALKGFEGGDVEIKIEEE
ncbi:molybdopterin-guanine dinucleotide biosynthesis protein B [Candidatus Poribacteria bacterium]|nr:molybdopterin-guanine dinucleotide biosynthesis protein B [Candidatus Poribacteria bacterium]